MSELTNSDLSGDKHPLSTTIAKFVGSVLSYSLNTGYTVSAVDFAQICRPGALQTSYRARTLCGIDSVRDRRWGSDIVEQIIC